MKISTILDHIDSGHMALPKFQRGYVWNRDQVRGLMQSLYRGHPVGSLLVWVTAADDIEHRGGQKLATGTVRILLDGQQRITSLYGIIRGTPPAFFDGKAETFTGLHFHIRDEEFRFYQPVTMKDDPLWINVTELMQKGHAGLAEHITRFGQQPELIDSQGQYIGRLTRILGISEAELHAEEVTGEDKTVEVVVDIFNRVNSGGTKLSQGDLALAKICASWPDAREKMQEALARWQGNGYNFNLDWLLRNMNAIITGEARFAKLHDVSGTDVQNGLIRAEKSIDFVLNLIEGRLGLDHDRVLFGRYALPVMVRFVDQRNSHLNNVVERDRLLYWYFQAAMWGRFSGSTESTLDSDLRAIEDDEEGIGQLLENLRLWHGNLRIEPEHFRGWSLGARFYPVLYAMTRVGDAEDWGSGLTLKKEMLGKMSSLEVHHIFPKSLLYRHGYSKSEANAIANFCLQTKQTNLRIGAQRPSSYFRKIEDEYPGSLASQWIPMQPQLWEIENYLLFLEERQRLLAEAANLFLEQLRHQIPEQETVVQMSEMALPRVHVPSSIPGGVEDDDERAVLLALNRWLRDQGLPEGVIEYELTRPTTGEPIAILDLAWPDGLQAGYSDPVALLLSEGPETLQAANDHGFRHFTDQADFRRYVQATVMALDATQDVSQTANERSYDVAYS